jgi:hypothetical protein
MSLKSCNFAAVASLAVALGCAPDATPITKKGYQGQPPLGDPIVLTDYAPLDVDGDGTPENWRWIPFPDSTCANGSTTGLAIDWLDPQDGGTGDLLVFFDGGGACWNWGTCTAIGTAVDRTFSVEKFKVEARDYIPSSITSRAHLPAALAGATIVFVPYCTGDVHGGDNVVEYGTWPSTETWNHKGHANVMAYLRRLGATFDPARLVVAGSSAGGFGALVNYEAFRWYWPEAEAFLVDDSGPALVNNDVPADFRQAWFANWGIGAAIDPFCTACRDDLSAAWTELSDMHRGDRMAFVSHLQDQVMGPFMLSTGSQFEAELRQLEQDVLAPTPNVRTFYENLDDHMMLTPLSPAGTADYTGSHYVGALTLRDWLDQMLAGDAAWGSVSD